MHVCAQHRVMCMSCVFEQSQALINLKKDSQNYLERKAGHENINFTTKLAVLGESGQPAKCKGDNRLPVLAFHSNRNEELKRLVIQGLCCHYVPPSTPLVDANAEGFDQICPALASRQEL